MKPDDIPLADRAALDLELLFQFLTQATQAVVDTNDPALVADHLQHVRGIGKEMVEKAKDITRHADVISQDILPTMFFNRRMKTAKFIGVGRVTINQRWSATILNPVKAFAYLRENGEGGAIKETVHHETLGALARIAAVEKKKPFPEEIFRVSTMNYTSIEP